MNVKVFAAVLLLGSSSYALAADPALPIEEIPTGFNWTGGYVGGHAGYSWQDLEYENDEQASEGGFLGGIYVGYNYQMPNNIVLGAEADIGFGGLDFDEDELEFNSYTAVKTEWNGHLRARLGYAVDRALFYVAGGAALARVKLDDTDSGWGEDTNTHLGWSIGAGVDYALTDNLILRGEYLYDDYGTKTYDIDYNGSPNYSSDLDLTASTVRIGLAYKF